jgi:hypothetical protein
VYKNVKCTPGRISSRICRVAKSPSGARRFGYYTRTRPPLRRRKK